MSDPRAADCAAAIVAAFARYNAAFRAITRRAERCTWALAQHDTVAPEVMRYLNRLSDLLFVVARVLARHENGQEVLWRRL